MKNNKLQSLCNKIGSGATPRGGKESYGISGISLIRSQNVLDYAFSLEGLAYINEVQADQLKAVTVEKDDVLINITGDSVARVCIVPDYVLPARVNQHVCIVRPNRNELEPIYLMLYLMHKKNTLLQLASSGGTRNALTKNMLENFIIGYPELANQRFIIDKLLPLFKKIRVNNTLIHKYEDLISALYQSWFSDFNYPDTTGEMRESENLHIEVPKDWKEVKFGEFLTSCSEKIGDIEAPVYSATNNGIALRDDKFNKNLSKSQKNNKKIVKDDLIFGLSREILNFGVVTAEIGSVSPVYQVFKIDQTVLLPFILELEIRINMQNYMDILQLGAREGQGINKDYLLNKYILVPDMKNQKIFEKIYLAIQNKISKLKEENAVLAEIRDTLLPKLMSGELQVEVGEN